MTLPPLSIVFFALAIFNAMLACFSWRNAITHKSPMSGDFALGVIHVVTAAITLWIGLTLTP